MTKKYDVVGIGNAIVDILTHTENRFLEDNDLKKSAMTLVEEARSAELYSKMGPARECSGGSGANTCAGVASLGGQAAFTGKVKQDQLGKIFTHDIQSTGVTFTTALAVDGPATATSMIFVTPDGERTMQTYLGACITMDVNDLEEDLIRDAKILYLEGYVWDTPAGREIFQTACAMARQHGTKVSLSLSDPWFVDRHRDDLHSFVRQNVDILLGNEEEATSLFKVNNLYDAVDIIDSICPVAAVTRGAEGSIIAYKNEWHEVAAEPVTKVEDTTGAGDLYAAGFLYGWAQGMDPRACGQLGSIAAAEIISHLGARPEVNLADLVKQKMAA